MKKELRLKPIKNKSENELSAFINTIYNEIYNMIDNLNQQIRQENEPLHHLLLVTSLNEARDTLRMFERMHIAILWSISKVTSIWSWSS